MTTKTLKKIKTLEEKCKELRQTVLELCHRKGGHISSSFSCTELLVALYYTDYLNISSKNYNKKTRDIFVLSKGHGAEMLYAILADLNFFPKKWLKNSYRENDCKLGGHASHKVPGVEFSTGSLGHGLNFIGGTALASKMDKNKNKHVVLLGDAECTAGSVWEAASFISYEKLNNVTAIVDFNKIGNFDFVSKFMNLEIFAERWKSCAWDVYEVKDGNNLKKIIHALKKTSSNNKRPKVIIAHTIKGKGVKIFENDRLWATRQVSSEIFEKVKKELL